MDCYENVVSSTVSCIDRQIKELEARKYAIQQGYCYTGYYSMQSYIQDDEAIVEEENKNDRN